MSAPESVLIVRLSALGDAVHVLPCLAALRDAFPSAKLGWAIEDKAVSLLRDHPQLDRVHVMRRKDWTRELKGGHALRALGAARGVLAELRRERYQVAIDFQSNFRSGLLTRLSGAPRRLGQPRPYRKEGSGLFYTDTVEPVAREVHKIERNLALLAALGVTPPAPPRPVLGAVDDDGPLRDVGEERASGERAVPRVVIHAGVSAFGALKAWPEERFVELGTLLAADGCEVLYAWGGAKERAQAARLSAQAPGTRLAPPTGSVLELARMLALADLFVGVDSGPLHLAAGLGTPVLGLYGPKHPGTYGPYWPGSRVVRSGEHCSPCRHRKCPREDARWVDLPGERPFKISPCMDHLEAGLAHEAARAILAEAASA